MIFDIDHIAYTTNQIDKLSSFMTSIGFERAFTSKKVLNPQVKNPFLRNPSKFHDLSLFKKSGSLSIELIQYEHAGKFRRYILPRAVKADEILLPYSDDEAENFKKLSKNFPSNWFTITTSDLKKSEYFWNLFGFFQTTGSMHYLLEFKSRLSGIICQIELLNKPQLEMCKLDDLGFSGFAFVSTNLEQDRMFFKQKGIYVTDIDEIVINRKNLKLFFAIGPSDEKVEVIGVS